MLFLNFQNILISLFLIYSASAIIFGLKHRKKPFGLCLQYNLIGAFVWADALIFGAFFTFASLLCFILQDFILFWLIFAVFWTVRSIGEQIYWFNEQFAVSHKNPPHTLWPAKLYKGEEVWITMQIIMQCISVVSIIISVCLFSIWL